jgi:flagellar biosynthesis component FlhA
MQIRQMTIEYIMLFSYFLFLFGLLIGVNNIPYLAAHPVAESLTEKIRYNLRDVPRVDYKETSSDEEDEQEQPQEESSEAEAEAEESQEDVSLHNSYAGTEDVLSHLRRRQRDPVAMSRVMDSLH